MSKKDYICLAHMMRECKPGTITVHDVHSRKVWTLMLAHMVGWLAADNPNFSKAKFEAEVFRHD